MYAVGDFFLRIVELILIFKDFEQKMSSPLIFQPPPHEVQSPEYFIRGSLPTYLSRPKIFKSPFIQGVWDAMCRVSKNTSPIKQVKRRQLLHLMT